MLVAVAAPALASSGLEEIPTNPPAPKNVMAQIRVPTMPVPMKGGVPDFTATKMPEIDFSGSTDALVSNMSKGLLSFQDALRKQVNAVDVDSLRRQAEGGARTAMDKLSSATQSLDVDSLRQQAEGGVRTTMDSLQTAAGTIDLDAVERQVAGLSSAVDSAVDQAMDAGASLGGALEGMLE